MAYKYGRDNLGKAKVLNLDGHRIVATVLDSGEVQLTVNFPVVSNDPLNNKRPSVNTKVKHPEM